MKPLVIINKMGIHIEVDSGLQTILEQHRSICKACSDSCEHQKVNKLEMYECTKAEAFIEAYLKAHTIRQQFRTKFPKIAAALDQDRDDFHEYPLKTRWQVAQMLKQLIPTKNRRKNAHGR